ncbi:MAG TPA: DUF1569 domain-containing protein [Planctomycetota bacterium]|nr:DUF1569 domain-containing protein [Planctomycetota bacterium]
MKTLFHATDAAEMVQRIQRLGPDSRPQWGKMDAAQMLAHCQVPLRVATGELELKRGLIGILFGGMAKRKLLADKPFGHNMPTAPEFRVADRRDFAREKAELIARVQRFQQGGANGLTKKPHPFFGMLAVPEWEALQWKHLDHHLRQFGV